MKSRFVQVPLFGCFWIVFEYNNKFCSYRITVYGSNFYNITGLADRARYTKEFNLAHFIYQTCQLSRMIFEFTNMIDLEQEC